MVRKHIVINNVGTTYVQGIVLGLPISLRIKRVKVDLISGDATEFACKIQAKPSTSTIQDSILEYDLVPTLDYLDDFIVFPYRRKETDFGQLFVYLKTDTTGNKLKFSMEYEK